MCTSIYETDLERERERESTVNTDNIPCRYFKAFLVVCCQLSDLFDVVGLRSLNYLLICVRY